MTVAFLPHWKDAIRMELTTSIVRCANMFSMEEQQDYHFYIEDLFWQRENPSALYIDLVSCSLNAK